MESGDNRSWRGGGRKQTPPRSAFEAGDGLTDGWDIGHAWIAACSTDCDQVQPARADMRQRRRAVGENQVDTPRHQIDGGLRTAFIRNMRHRHTRQILEHFTGEMGRGARTGGAEIEFAGVRPGERDHVLYCFDRHRRMHHQQQVGVCHQRDGCEILLRVVGQLRIQRYVNGMGATRAEQQRVAIGSRFCHQVRADTSAGACAIVDDHRLSPGLSHFLRDRSRKNVRYTRRRKGRNDAD